MRTTAIDSTQFRAIKVKSIEPVLKEKNVTFYNNSTAMLDNPVPLFIGIRQFVDVIQSTLRKRIFTMLDEFDVNRLLSMVNYFPDKFLYRRLLGIIGAGLNNTALLLDDKEVLCVSDDMNVFKTRKFEDFDLPIKTQGTFSNNSDNGWYIRDLGAPISKKELEKLGKQIEAKGYELDDWRPEQGCRIGKKLYLLDFDCAKISPYINSELSDD